MKPKFVHQIIEELTEDYDLPDVEIRKVLIEELTKEQLMQEEKAERLRLVEEQKQRKLEEARQAKEAQEAERQRIRAEKAAEQERIRKEKELQKQKELYEQMQREAELRRRKNILAAELEYFREHLPERIEQRRIAREKAEEARRQQEYLEAQRLKEEQEQRRREEAQRQHSHRAAEAHHGVAQRIADGQQQDAGLHAQLAGQHGDEKACQQVADAHERQQGSGHAVGEAILLLQ